MRSDYPQERSNTLVWVLCSLVAAFILEIIFIQYGAGGFLKRNLLLSAANLEGMKVWTLLTYAFLHDPDNLLHVVFNLLGFYFMGRAILPVLGNRKFFTFCTIASIFSGASWLAFHWTAGSLLGASGIISGLFIIYCLLYPDRPITILLLFIPVTLPKTRYLAWGLLLFDLSGLFFFELPDGAHAVAHSAHLGGMLAGYLYYQLTIASHKWTFSMPWNRTKQELIPPAWVGKVRQSQTTNPVFQVNLSEREHLKAEVDRILDKINSQGFGSLTPAEKKTLDDARDMMSKR